MKRHIWLAALALICILALTGCQCKHEWKDATCDAPKTCSLCDATIITHGFEIFHLYQRHIVPKSFLASGKTIKSTICDYIN
jgi:hypothetical protein